LIFRVGNTDVNLGRSTPHGKNGLGPILSPPPGPHTFQPGHSLQPGIGGFGSSTDSVASPGTDNTDVSEKEGFCQVGCWLTKKNTLFYMGSFQENT
jgi:hypothetical protein